MSDKITSVKLKYGENQYSNAIPIGVQASNVIWDSSHSLTDVLGEVNTNSSIQNQINAVNNNASTALNDAATANNAITAMTSSITTGSLNIQGTDASSTANRSITIGTNNTTASRLYLTSAAGTIYFYSNSATGDRGIFSSAHGTMSNKDLIHIDDQNNIFIGGALPVYVSTNQQITGSKTFTSAIRQHLNNRYNVIYFKSTNDSSNYTYDGCFGFDFGSNTTPTSTRFYIQQASFSDGIANGNYELYWMPTTADGLTSTMSYSFLTTKNPVTIAQGGTGANTLNAAKNNLGIHPIRVPSGGSTTIAFGTGGYRGMLFLCGTSDGFTGAYSVWLSTSSSTPGAPHVQIIKEATSITTDLATAYQITLINSSTSTPVSGFLIDATDNISATVLTT